MQDLNDLYYFAVVVEHHGFAAAARSLGIPKSKLSRRVATLEARLGARLIQRSTRKFVITEIGKDYYEHCKAMMVEAEAAQEAIDRVRTDPQGSVHMACPVALLHFEVAPLLARFMVECPRVKVTLDATNRRVDVIEEGFDLALRVRFPPLQDSDLVMRALGESTQCLVASPDFLARHQHVRTPADLTKLPSMANHRNGNAHAWTLTSPDGQTVQVPHEPHLITDDMFTLRTAALEGVGAVQLPVAMVRDVVRSGTLQRLLPEWVPTPGVVHAVFPSRRGVLPTVRRLIDFLADGFERYSREINHISP